MVNSDKKQMFGIDFPMDLRNLKWFENHCDCGPIEIYDLLIGLEDEPGVLDISASVNCVKCGTGEYIHDRIPIEHGLEVLAKILLGTAHNAGQEPIVKLCVDADTWLAIRKFQEREEQE